MLSESKLIEAFTQVPVGFFHLLFNFVGRPVGRQQIITTETLIYFFSLCHFQFLFDCCCFVFFVF